MKNLKVSKKLFISYALVLLLLLLATIVSIRNLADIGSQVETFYDGPFTVKGSADIINAKFEEMQKSVYRALANEDLTITTDAIKTAQAASQVIQEHLPIIQEHFLGDMEIVRRLESSLTQLVPMREHVLELATKNKNSEAAAYMEKNNIPVIVEAQAELDALIATSNQKAEELIASLRAVQHKSMITLIILAVVSVAVSIAFGTYITRGITTPVQELKDAADKIANGDLKAAEIEYESLDELGELAGGLRTTIARLSDMISDLTYLLKELAAGNFDIRTKAEESYVGEFQPLLIAIRKMHQSLSDTLRQINMSADQVSSGSEQVSNSAQALAQGAAEQASSVEELAATINEISGQVKNNAENAEEANHVSGQVGTEMMQSNQKMQEMIEAMNQISKSSSEIGKIIKTIEDIAFQTNILALNAAVEAARAGEAGKGFAVVADEVRNLASKSAEASKSTSSLIENALKAVEHGTDIADETAKSLTSAVEGAQNVTAIISKISAASNEQSQAVNQVTQGVDQISSVVQTNSATAEESAAASEELSGQAQILKDLVSQFRLRPTNGSEPAEPARQQYESEEPVMRAPSMNGQKY